MIYSAISTPRLFIYPPSGTDEELREMVGWLNNPEVVRFSEQRHYHHNINTQIDYIKSFNGVDQYLGLYTEDILIGTMSIHTDVKNKVANVGIMIGDKSLWGQGIGHEAWKAVCDKLLQHDIRKIEAGCMSCNTSMMSVCSRYGMMEEGRQEDHFLYHDVPMDLVHWGKIK